MVLSLPTGRPGRLLALAITLAVPILMWLLVVAPLRDWYEDRGEALAQRQQIAARMTGLVASLPALREQSMAGAQEPQASALLEGETDAIAAATLQQLAQDMAKRAGASLSSAETLPATQTGQTRRIALRVATAAPWPVLVNFLASLEAATPRILVDNLRIQGGRAAAQTPGPLAVTLTVIAFRAASPAAAMSRQNGGNTTASAAVP